MEVKILNYSATTLLKKLDSTPLLKNFDSSIFLPRKIPF